VAQIQAGERMDTLLRDRLDYSRVGHKDDGETSVHVDEDLEGAMSLLRSTIDRHCSCDHSLSNTADSSRAKLRRHANSSFSLAVLF
jgi:hypothetical protein